MKLTNTNIKVPKKYHKMIKEIDYEGKDDGYWAYLEEGYISPDTDSHTIHEYKQSDLLKIIRNVTPADGRDSKSVYELEYVK